MFEKIKARKCKWSKCRAPFDPKTDWQKYCKPRHRIEAMNARRANIIRRAQKIIEAQGVA